MESEYNQVKANLEFDIANNSEAISTCKNELQGKIATLTAKYDAKVASIESMIETLNATDTVNANRIATLEAQVAILLNPPSYTVNFDTDGANAIESQVVEHGEKLIAPTAPQKDGYIFDGWYVGNEKWSFIGYTVSQDMTLTAKWHVAYDLSGISFNGATFAYDGVEKSIYISGDLPEKLVVMYTGNKQTNAGKTLACAYIMDESGYIYTTLTAVLTIEKADLSFTMSDFETVYDGTAKRLFVNEEIPDGVKVTYENNAQINAGTYEVVAKVTVNGNYNEVEDVSATLTINKATPSVTVIHNTENFTLNDELVLDIVENISGKAALSPGQTLTLGTRTYNYIFTPDNENYNSTTGSVSITVYAKVEFFDIDGTILDIQYVEKGGYITDFTPVYNDNSGYSYVFSGWKIQNSSFSATSPVYANLSLTADYSKEIITYTITYNLNGGASDIALTETYTILDTLSIPVLSKIGYTFNGWSGNGIEDGTLSFELDRVIGDREYTASFTPNVYTLKLDAKGGSCDSSKLEITYDEVVNIPTPYRFGYDFLGWYYGDTELVNGDLWNYAENIEVIAKWEESAITKITTAEELASIAYKLNGNYILMNDINLQGAEWGVIGDATAAFSGTFDGNGYTISNFKISISTDYAGFFGANSGSIKNLTITEASITSGSTGAAILVGKNIGTIYNCSVSGVVNKSTTYVGGLSAYSLGNITLSSASATVCNGKYTGGLVGYVESGKIEKSYSEGSAEITQKTSLAYLGGLVGAANGSFEIADSYSRSYVNFSYNNSANTTEHFIGGLIGKAYGTQEENAIIQCCHFENAIETIIINNNSKSTVVDVFVGGLVGRSDFVLYNECFSKATINVSAHKPNSVTTQFEDWFEYTVSVRLGGLVGCDVSGEYKNSYAYSAITNDVYCKSYYYYALVDNAYNYAYYQKYAYAYTYLGGLIGHSTNSKVDTCYAYNSIDSKTESDSNDKVSSGSYSNYSYTYSYIGGCVGYSVEGSEINNSFSTIEELNVVANVANAKRGTVRANTYGGICGNIMITSTNCYRYSGTASNIEIGTATSLSNLKSVNFITEILGWDSEIWMLQNGEFPQLKLYEKE